ncbi:hypothetical protein ABPG75_009248 [Micractinium tetrahymenae]
MGITALWQLLRAEEVVEWYRGGIAEEHAALLAAVDGQAVAIDLSTWIMQADQQTALTPHFSREERCMKVAFERALQWLRHGCLPVPVVEGRPPDEKLAAQRARFEARNGYAGGGSQAGAAQFQRLGQTVGRLLEELGLPVFYAPGEAEAVCAALNRAGCVDAAASSDSDTLLYGAEAVLQSLKMSTTQKEECELRRVRLGSIRRRLGLQRGGAKALGVLATLSGSDYDLDGAQGVGSVGGLAIARYLLQGDPDDSQVLQRLAALVQRPPKQELLELTQCTGCQTCGHEGGRKGKIKRHSSRNRCDCCPFTEDSACELLSFARCGCAFHRLETERRVERILERVRASPGFLQEAQAAVAVFERQGAEADAYVQRRLAELGCQPGQRLHWLHRPRVRGVFDMIEAKRKQMLWDLAAVRSKLLPVLLEWDLVQQAAAAEEGGAADEAEFRAAAIQKVHGLKSKGDLLTEAHWRYVLSWERLEGDAEQLGMLEVRPKKPRAGSKAAAAAAAAAGDEDDEGGRFLGSQTLSQGAGQRSGAFSPGGDGGQVEILTVQEFDQRWLKEQPAEHRAVRISAVHRLLPHLETAYQQQLLAGPGKASKAAAGGSKKARGAGTRKAGAAPGSGGSRAAGAAAAKGGRKQHGGAASRAVRELLLDEEEEEEAGGAGAGRASAAQQQQQQQQQAADITRYLAQRRPGSAAAPAASGKAAAGKQVGRGYGLAASGAASAVAPEQQQQQHLPSYQQHLPASAASMQALLSRALGSDDGQQQQLREQQRPQHRAPPEQRTSPSKKLRSPRGSLGRLAGPAAAPVATAAAAFGASPGGVSAGADSEFEVLLTSPESPTGPTQPRQARLDAPGQGVGGGAQSDEEEDGDLPPLALALAMSGMAPRERHGSRGKQAGEEGQQHAAPPAQQQQQPGRQPGQQAHRHGMRSSAGAAPGADIRAFFAASPASPPAKRVAAAGAQHAAPVSAALAAPAGAGAAAAAAHPTDVVDLVTPPRAHRPQLGGAVPAPGPSAGFSEQPAPAPAAPAPLPASPIDLTLSDDD